MNEFGAHSIKGEFFDGRSARAQPALLRLINGELLLYVPGGNPRRLARKRLTWPERQRHGQRQILLADGGVISFADGAAFDAWAAAGGRGDSVVVRWQQSWRLTLLALVLLVVGLWAGWRWGLPLASDALVASLPREAEQPIGQAVLTSFDKDWLKPSQIPRRQQQAIEARLAQALSAAEAAQAVPAAPRYAIHFREGGKALGPNAFALPGGDVVITDALVKLLEDRPDALVGVLAHELGHVEHRHGLRITLRAGAVGVAAGVMVGDFSTLLAAAPALLASQSYSRDFERQADGYSRSVLLAAGIDPGVMALFFERAAKAMKAPQSETSEWGIALSSHPADAERMAFFRKK